MVSVFLLFAGAILVVFSGEVARRTWQDISLQRRAKATFLPVDARVVTSQRAGGTRKDAPYADIVYRYTVEGRAFESWRMTVGGHSTNLRLLSRYPVGSSVTAYVDPQDPSYAVLDPAGEDHRGLVALALGTFAGGLVLVVFGIRSVRKLVSDVRELMGLASAAQTSLEDSGNGALRCRLCRAELPDADVDRARGTATCRS
jgi:hypothetical protein